MSEDLIQVPNGSSFTRESDRILFATLGALNADMKTVKLFIQSAATKDEVGEVTEALGAFMARDTAEHRAMRDSIEHFGRLLVGDDDGNDGLVSRVQDLEKIPKLMKQLFWAMVALVIGFPPFAVACIELYQQIRGLH